MRVGSEVGASRRTSPSGGRGGQAQLSLQAGKDELNMYSKNVCGDDDHGDDDRGDDDTVVAMSVMTSRTMTAAITKFNVILFTFHPFFEPSFASAHGGLRGRRILSQRREWSTGDHPGRNREDSLSTSNCLSIEYKFNS